MSLLRERSPYFNDFINKTNSLYQKYGKLIKWSTEPVSILELGIGNGILTEKVLLPIIPKNIKEYIGCDVFEPILDFASEIVTHDKFKTYQLDVATKNLPNELKNRFDHIFSNNLFHHIQDTR